VYRWPDTNTSTASLYGEFSKCIKVQLFFHYCFYLISIFITNKFEAQLLTPSTLFSIPYRRQSNQFASQATNMGFFKASDLSKECNKAAQILKGFVGMDRRYSLANFPLDLN
jgi:hypothetical protein